MIQVLLFMEEKEQVTVGFFQKLLSGIFSGGGASAAARKELKQMSKILRKSRFKFYDPRLNELEPQLARLFYQLYRFFGPLQQTMSRFSSSESIKTYMVERNLSKEAFELRAHFSEDAIRAESKQQDTRATAKKLQQDFSLFKKDMASSGIKRINNEYSSFRVFLQLVNFDYYYVMKRFDPKIPELDFVYKTHFESVIGLKLIDELKDFVALLEAYDNQAPWDDIFNIVNEFRGAEVLSTNIWKKVKKSLDEVKKSKILETIIAVIDEDPGYTVKAYDESENIVAAYVELIGKELQESLTKIVGEKKNRNINEFVRKVFGNKPPASRIKNYSERLNTPIVDCSSKSFIYMQPINYLKSFFLDFIKKDIRDVSNHFQISGKWFSPVPSQQLSDSFNRLLEISDELMEFDKTLSEDFRRGQSIRTYTRGGDRKNSTILERIVDEVNNDAKVIIVETAQNLVKLAKILRSLIEDYGENKKKLLSNWKEVESNYKGELLPEAQHTYKKIYEMVQLLQMFLAK